MATGPPCLMSRPARLCGVDRLPPGEQTKGSTSYRAARILDESRQGRKHLSGERVERRLAAILAADVAGYSRLMGRDEAGTLARLRAHRRELIDPKIAEYRGRTVKTTGDGLLVEFASPVEAVRCAAEIQKAMREREGSLPEEGRIEIRVGINLGDVIIDEDDVYGDGVNIAARLEALADPGGVMISSAVFEQVRDRVPDSFEDLGDQQVKNIVRPVRVYRLAQPTEAS